MHEDADTDGFGRLLLRGAGAGGTTGVRRDATVTPRDYPDDHRDQLFVSLVERARSQCGVAHLAESPVHVRDHLTQFAVLRIEVFQNVVMVAARSHAIYNSDTPRGIPEPCRRTKKMNISLSTKLETTFDEAVKKVPAPVAEP